MTRMRPRHNVSIIALLTLLMALLAPAAAFAETGNADNEPAATGGDAGSAESDTSDTGATDHTDDTDEAAEKPADDTPEIYPEESDTSDLPDVAATSRMGANTTQGGGDKHCWGHNHARKFEGAGTYTVDGVTFEVSGTTVTVSGGDAELCVKAATDNSGKVTVADGSHYDVDFVNGGGQNPAISYLVVYSVTPTDDTNGDDTGGDDTGSGEPCRMIDSTVNGGEGWFEIGPEGCEGTVGPVSFSTYKLPSGMVEPFAEQILVDHDENNGSYYPEGEYTVSASIEGLCAWQSDLYRGDSQDHAPHDHYIDGMNVGWDYHEDKDCFDEAPEPDPEPTGDIALTVDADTVCVGDEVTFTATNDSDKKVMFKTSAAGHYESFWLYGGETETFTVTMPVATTLTVDWSAWQWGPWRKAEGSLTVVVEDCEDAAPAIDIEKSADTDVVTLIGEDDTAEVTYTYEITNTGNVTLDLAELSDDKIADLDVSDLDDTTLDADESTTVTQTVELGADDFDANGEHTNVVTVTGVVEGGDVDDPDDTVTATDDETVTVIVEDVPDVDPGIGGDDNIDLGATRIEVCPSSDVTLTLTSDSLLPLDVTFSSDDLGLDEQFEDATVAAGEAWTATLSGLAVGEYVIDYSIDVALGVSITGSFEITVENCGEVEPGVGSDGSTTDLGVTDLEVCVGSDVNLTLTTTSVDEVDVSFTGDLTLDDATMAAGNPWTETLTGLDAGTYTIAYTVDLGNGTTAEGTFTIVVEDCGAVTPGVGSDDGDVVVGDSIVEICPTSDAVLRLDHSATTPVAVEFASDDLVLGDEFEDVMIGGGNAAWTATLSDLEPGSYTITYTIALANDATETGSFTIMVEDCGEVTPGTGSDGENTDLGVSELEICPDGTATLSLSSDSDEPLEVSFEGLDGYVLDGQFDDVTIGDGETWTATLDELSVGTYRIRYTVPVGNGSFQSGIFEITVEDCEGVTPGVGGDGGTTDLGEERIEICPDSTVTLTLTSDSDEPLTVEFSGEDGLDLDGLQLLEGSFADTTIGAGDAWSATIGDLAIGTYEIDYLVAIGNGSFELGTFTIVVEDCGDVDGDIEEQPPVDNGTPGTPDVPVDGDEDDTPTTPAVLDLDLELVCPDGVAGYVVTATGENLDATQGVLSVAYGNTDIPFQTVTITLGEETALEWPVGIDELDASDLVVWVTVGDAASEMVTLDTAEYDELCTEVLDEVIDAPEDGDTPDDGDAPVDNDEVARDDEDEVLDVVLDQPADEVTAVDADDTVAIGDSDAELAYTGGSILALLMAGLMALLSGAGLLRRRS